MEDSCKFDRNELEGRLRENLVEELAINEILELYPEDYRCRRLRYSEDGFCIFHTEEKPENFWELFWEELERMEREDEVIDLSGFIFPEILSVKGKLLVLSKPTRFIGAKFRGVTEFKNAVFQDLADFRGVEFQVASFTGAKFKKADFRGVKFEVADFIDSESQEAYFIGAKFREAYFTDAEFGVADFRSAEFRGIADFMCAEFEVADFVNARFQGVADFRSAEFRGIADFMCAEFGVADFRSAEFKEAADFTRCRFKRVALFVGTVFRKNAIFITPDRDPSGLMLFVTTEFGRPKHTVISGFPLSNLSFLLTDLADVNLIPPRSPKALDLLDERLLSKSREELSDVERRALEILEGLGLLSIETLALELKSVRKNLEVNKFYSEAGDLHVKEMRYRRRIIKERENWRDLPELIANWFYGLLNYGESIMRPVLGMLLTVISSAFYVAFKSGPLQGILQRTSESIPIMTLVLLQVGSLRDFTIGIEVPELIFVEALVRALSVVLFGTLFIALRRRLERK